MSTLTDQELIRTLRTRADSAVPPMSLDVSAVHAAGRRRLVMIRLATGAGIAATAAVLAFAVPGSLIPHHRTGPAGGGHAAGPTLSALEFRTVTSTTEGPCTAAPLTAATAGAACDFTGAMTYQLGAPLGTATPTSVSTTDRPDSSQVYVTFDDRGRATVQAITAKAVGTQLAVLVHGRVIAAPRVMEPLSAAQGEFAGGTAAQAQQIADEIRHPSTTPAG